MLIIANGLPYINAIFIIFKIFSKILGVSIGNKRLVQLIFENLEEKPKRFKNMKSGVFKLNDYKNKQNIKNSNNNLKVSKINIINSMDNKKDSSSLYLSLINDKKREIDKNIIVKRKNPKYITELKLNNNMKLNNDNNKQLKENKNNNISSLHSPKLNIRKIFNMEDKYPGKVNKNISKNKAYYINKKLFPYKYYLCSVFMKNIGVSKKSIFFKKKFVFAYNFICQLIDISSYLMLQKEFQILKNTLIIRKYKTVIENREKININDKSFDMDIKECLEFNKLSILGKLKNSKDCKEIS